MNNYCCVRVRSLLHCSMNDLNNELVSVMYICDSLQPGLLYFPGNMLISRTGEILGNREILGNTGKYKISNKGLLVGPVLGVLTCWKLIKLGTKTH